jgi:4-diphosphocytidyl-2-C-methyl-D-erythritol kinase
MSPLTLPSPAKLNLSLRILGRREDGFHELDTTMVKLEGLADDLTFRENSTFSFTCDDPSLPDDGDNLVVKAVRAYEQASGTTCKYSIHLTKRIPHGAGLGGGSSNAATTLMGLDQLHNDRLGMDRLLPLAAELGSDVPFFLLRGPARCTGRGEILEKASEAPSFKLLLLKPTFGVATPDAYRRWQASRELPGVLYRPQLLDSFELVNDLERPVFEKHRFLAETKTWLLARREVAAALLCGSGSTIFAVLFPDADGVALARCARHELDPSLWHWFGTLGA